MSLDGGGTRHPGDARDAQRPALDIPYPAALAGTLAVALALVGGRWGSYVGANPLFLTDVLIVLAIAHAVLSKRRRGARGLTANPLQRLPAVFAVLFIWVALRLILSTRADINVIRDGLPYLYIGLTVLAFWSAKNYPRATTVRTERTLLVALGLHMAWFLAVRSFPPLVEAMPLLPGTSVHIFQPRNDFDSAMVGAFAALLLHAILKGTPRIRLHVTLLALACAAVLLTGSRAALLGSILCIVLVVFVFLSRPGAADASRKRVVIALIPFVVGAAGAGILSTDLGTRLLATVSESAASTEIGAGAAGTTSAREDAWKALSNWTVAEPGRLMHGAGFGPNVMADSGAGALLITGYDGGDSAVRSPHNYWVGSFARLGVLGIVLLGLSTLTFLRAVIARRSQLSENTPALTFAVIAVGLLIPATLGVILESPFGAVPFWWCIGAFFGATTARANLVQNR